MRPVVLGRISGLFGVRGWVKVYSYTEPAENIFSQPRWLVSRDNAWQPMRLRAGRNHGRALIAQLAPADGPPIDDRDTAALLVGAEIAVARADLPPLPDGETYWADLIGCAVVTVAGEALGQVTDVTDTGAHGLLAVRGEREYLIPLVRGPIVRAIDLETAVITVDWWDE